VTQDFHACTEITFALFLMSVEILCLFSNRQENTIQSQQHKPNIPILNARITTKINRVGIIIYLGELEQSTTVMLLLLLLRPQFNRLGTWHGFNWHVMSTEDVHCC
jgi:hypothetical protein